MSLRLEVYLILLGLFVCLPRFAEAVPAVIGQKRTIPLSGVAVDDFDIVRQTALPPSPPGADAQTMALFMKENADLALADAQENFRKIETARGEVNKAITAKTEQLNKLLADPDASAAAIESLRTELGLLEQDRQLLNNEAALAAGNGMMSQGAGGAAMGRGSHISAGEALLIGAIAGAAIGAGVALAASGGGGGDNSAPAVNPNDELAKARAAAEQDYRNRMILEGQLVNLGEQRTIDFAAMDAQFLGVVVSQNGPQGPVPTYGGLSEAQAMGGAPVRCFSSSNQQVACFSNGPTAHGMVSSRPVRCYDVNNRNVPCGN